MRSQTNSTRRLCLKDQVHWESSGPRTPASRPRPEPHRECADRARRLRRAAKRWPQQALGGPGRYGGKWKPAADRARAGKWPEPRRQELAPGGNEESGLVLRAGRQSSCGEGRRGGAGATGAAQALLTQSPWRSFSENRAAAQSHAGECHQSPASGRRLPVVPEGKAGGAGL